MSFCPSHLAFIKCFFLSSCYVAMQATLAFATPAARTPASPLRYGCFPFFPLTRTVLFQLPVPCRSLCDLGGPSPPFALPFFGELKIWLFSFGKRLALLPSSCTATHSSFSHLFFSFSFPPSSLFRALPPEAAPSRH